MTTDRLPPPGVVAFCAPGNEMLAAATCNIHGMRIAEVIGDPDLSGDDLIVVNPATLGLLRADRGHAARYWLRVALARVREDEGRAEWVESVRQRLGLITMSEWPGEKLGSGACSRDWPGSCSALSRRRTRRACLESLAS